MEGLPKINQENKIEKPKIKEGVDFVFEQHPELVQIGTKEQYCEYLDSIFPESKIKDILYHGSPNTFEEFNNTSEDIIVSTNAPKGTTFLTTNFDTAKGYSENIPLGNLYKGTEKVYCALVNIKNPNIINFRGANFKGIGYEIINKNSRINANKEFNNQLKYFPYKTDILRKDKYRLFKNIYDINEVQVSDKSTDEFSLDSRDNGFDSSIIQNVVELGSVGDSIAVFDSSKQIHTLGSKEDIEKYKNFIKNYQDSQG